MIYPEISPAMLEKLDKCKGSKMSAEQRMEALFQQLDLSDLKRWSPQN